VNLLLNPKSATTKITKKHEGNKAKYSILLSSVIGQLSFYPIQNPKSKLCDQEDHPELNELTLLTGQAKKHEGIKMLKYHPVSKI